METGKVRHQKDAHTNSRISVFKCEGILQQRSFSPKDHRTSNRRILRFAPGSFPDASRRSRLLPRVFPGGLTSGDSGLFPLLDFSMVAGAEYFGDLVFPTLPNEGLRTRVNFGARYA